MADSVQQIKFELISYVKEFGGDFAQWSIGRAVDARKSLFEVHEVDPIQDIWLWKPALTCSAAAIVVKWMTQRQKTRSVFEDEDGHCVFIFKRQV